MALDIEALIASLESFYSMRGKSVLHVGAGGGQFVEYLKPAGKVVGIDSDPQAIALLNTALERTGMTDRYTVVQSDWLTVAERAEVVYFEFCLHEMADPMAALRHAQTLAPEIMIADHALESKWSWYAGETEKITRSWNAIRQFGIKREASFAAIHRFRDYEELQARLQGPEEPTVTRIQELAGKTNIEIEVPYRLAVV
ncbi:hypothetical protein C3F09_00525 [candidate division GN15 bacterium]|uniref:Class I SAM-dependent methyltransferase n=1 Tax=candidate division GN15 bacterium TaxID=2072418 RepID=A0A855XDC9_9BACT|nr:MAG: hypothetical protein C3F09_00525 [candidate division GN15 bacterium]